MSGDLDLSRLPRGQMEWRKFIESIAETDDRVERYFLEVKSDLNLNTKAHQAKVAKYILGSANRSAEQATRRFGGHGLMVLGVSSRNLVGITPFEAKDLAGCVTKYIGTDGPTWDFERIPVAENRDVIVIIVDPPVNQQVFTCRADGPENLTDGAIYIRADGETRLAKGDEIREIVDRTLVVARPAVDLDVIVVNKVTVCVYTDAALKAYVQRVVESRRRAFKEAQGAVDEIAGPYGAKFRLPRIVSPLDKQEDRTPAEYSAEIDAWEESMLRSGSSKLVDRLIGRYGARNYVQISNRSPRYLEDVEVQIHLDGPVRAVDALSKREDVVSETPRPPRVWGPHPINFHLNYPPPAQVIANLPRNTNGVVNFRNGGSVDLTFTLKALRPEGSFETDADDFCLLIAGATNEPVTGTWSATARGIDAVFRGQLVVQVEKQRDVSAALHQLLNPDT